MKTEIKIRFLMPEDVSIYRSLGLFSLSESPFAFSDSFEDQQGKTMSEFQNEILKSGDPLEVFAPGAFSVNNELIGFVKFRRDPRSKARHRASLHSLYVKPEYRKKGIAVRLASELLNVTTRIPGIEQLQLSCIVSHFSPIRFYEKLGFQRSGGLIEKDLIIEDKYVDPDTTELDKQHRNLKVALLEMKL